MIRWKPQLVYRYLAFCHSDKTPLLILFYLYLKQCKHNQSALEQWYVVLTWQIPNQCWSILEALPRDGEEDALKTFICVIKVVLPPVWSVFPSLKDLQAFVISVLGVQKCGSYYKVINLWPYYLILWSSSLLRILVFYISYVLNGKNKKQANKKPNKNSTVVTCRSVVSSLVFETFYRSMKKT